MKMELSEALTVLVTGIVVVFLVLVLLTGIIKLYGTIVSSLTNKSNSSKGGSAKKEEPKKATPAKATPAKAVTTPAPTVAGGISQEVIAVISAAVASMDSQTGFAIKSISKSKVAQKAVVSGRNVWANAGLMDATRPF